MLLHPTARERRAEPIVQLDDSSTLLHGRVVHHSRKLKGSCPERAHGSVSMWPVAGLGGSAFNGTLVSSGSATIVSGGRFGNALSLNGTGGNATVI